MALNDMKTIRHSSTGTLGKAISLLEMVVMSSRPLRFTDILDLSGQPRGTLHRQLVHLLEEGLLEQNEDQTYSAGVRLLTFAAQAWNTNDLRSVAAPHLRLLHEKTQESVHLGVLRGAEIVYLDKIDGKHAVRMHSQIGRVSPVFCTGVGKAALSLLSKQELDDVIDTIVFRAFTPSTVKTAAELKKQVAEIRHRGFGFDLEEHETGIQCIAVPVRAAGTKNHAAISVTGPAYRLTKQRLEGWADLIRGAAKNISNDLSVRLSPAHS
ncbi:IclR family transcriptional regulator [Rhizobium skierniewicense]|uniref:IclR family transcriptional regulator n=1 Tax=Rhizobium skierniewicense TaxID=984260 RepID=UPI001573F843|nr:IclR family transcriptional regulator [Rhizobium skierniewicense]NTF31001.1 IclR family transcriptional regulator [Rhizobium skierniewicense]